MTAQYLEFVRQQLIVATADLSGATKRAVGCFAENAQFTATARSRGRKKVYSEVKQKMVNPDGPPMSGSQSRAKGSSIASFCPLSILRPAGAGLCCRWKSIRKRGCCGITATISAGSTGDDHPVGMGAIQRKAGRRAHCKKTVDRLRQLIWLAAQDVKAELAGREAYEYQALAELVGEQSPHGQKPTSLIGWRCAVVL